MDQLNDVVGELAAAFPDTPIELGPDSISPNYGDEERLRARFQGKRWTEIDQSSLEFFGDALSFYSSASFAALLPAYLRATLQQTAAVDAMPMSLLRTLARRFTPRPLEGRIEQLTPAQRKAVGRSLVHLAMTLEEGLEKDAANAALDDHWRAVVQEGGAS